LAGQIATLLEAARHGDQAAWDGLVARFNGLVWSIARGYRLDVADAHDAVQMTWLRLVENLNRISEPDRLAAWLATTAPTRVPPAATEGAPGSSSYPRKRAERHRRLGRTGRCRHAAR
jgi:hypothetical protein